MIFIIKKDISLLSCQELALRLPVSPGFFIAKHQKQLWAQEKKPESKRGAILIPLDILDQHSFRNKELSRCERGHASWQKGVGMEVLTIR